MCQRRRILSFAWSDRLIALLARQGDNWEVVPRTTLDREAPWRLTRRLPPNVTVVSRALARKNLSQRHYDLIVCHGLSDLDDAAGSDVPIFFVVSGTPRLAEALGLHGTLKDRWRESSVTPVFLSDDSRQEWGWGGEVVPLGLDVANYGPYSGERPEVLVVGHLGSLLPETIDAPLLERATAGLPVRRTDRAVGDAEGEGASGRNWLLEAYSTYRVLLDPSPPWCRDGQHLDVLEAMASGQPVVTVPKPNSLIISGLNGIVEPDPARLHQGLLELLSDQPLAATLGAAARRTVAQRFSGSAFRDRWRDLVDTTARSPVVAA